jgi:hypothetical protein
VTAIIASARCISVIITDGANPIGDAAVIILGLPSADTLVQFLERVAFGHRGQPVTPEPADFAFHAAFFMRASDARLTVEGIEPKMRSEENPPLVFGATPIGGAVQHRGDRAGQIVVSDMTVGTPPMALTASM